MGPDFVPPPPEEAWFDPAAAVWVLSRYQDVLAAFREPRLWTTAISGKDQAEVRDDSGRLATRSRMQEALSQPILAQWMVSFEANVSAALARLPHGGPVDLLTEFARPCCLWLALQITGADPADAIRLDELGTAAFAGTGADPGSETRARASAATAELNAYFDKASVPMGEATFVGASQTMARLLANGWLALLRHPAECQRLRSQPELMPGAVEELLRYAGIVPTLYRRAHGPVGIGAAQIADGQRVHLKIASANRDPEQFPDPNRLDVTRRAVNHLALGFGRNSCVGNLVIRMASAVMTGALLRSFPSARIAGDPQWRTSPSFSWPDTVPVHLTP